MASLLVFITFLLLRLCTVQAVVLTLRPAVSPIYPVDLRQVRLRDHVNIAIPKSVTTGIGAGRQIYEVPSFISMANAFPPVSLNFPGGVSMLLKPQEYLLNTSFFNGVTTWETAFQKSQGPGHNLWRYYSQR